MTACGLDHVTEAVAAVVSRRSMTDEELMRSLHRWTQRRRYSEPQAQRNPAQQHSDGQIDRLYQDKLAPGVSQQGQHAVAVLNNRIRQ
jgi:hypothetical protein